MSQINFRVANQEKELMEEIAKYKKISLAELAKRMVLKELGKIKVDLAFDLYKDKKIRKKDAFKLSGLSYHQFLLEFSIMNK